MKKLIVFICTGNICRSCMAEVIAKELSAKNNVDDQLSFFSAGTKTWDGLPATDFARQVVMEWGYSLENHSSTSLNLELVNEADLLLTLMDEQKVDVLNNFLLAAGKVFSLHEFLGETQEVYDPFDGSLDDYRKAMRELMIKIDLVLKKVLEVK